MFSAIPLPSRARAGERRGGGIYRSATSSSRPGCRFPLEQYKGDQLLDVRGRGRLKDPKILEEQVRRMLADSRATALVKNSAASGSSSANMKAVDPDAKRVPDFDDNPAHASCARRAVPRKSDA